MPRKKLTDEQKILVSEARDAVKNMKLEDGLKYADTLFMSKPDLFGHFLNLFRSASPHHVLVLEADLPEELKWNIFHLSELVRQAGNKLTDIMKKRLEQLTRRKRYKWAKKEYGKAKEREDKASMEKYAAILSEMTADALLSENECKSKMIPIANMLRIPHIFGTTKAEDVWKGIEAVLYGDGKELHFTPFTEESSLRAKEPTRGIVMTLDDSSHLRFSLNSRGKKIVFGVLPGDRFITDEIALLERNMAEEAALRNTKDKKGKKKRHLTNSGRNALESERMAVGEYLCTNETKDTFRPCYATIVPEIIRGKLRVFVHVTIEGKAVPKYDRYGNLRHVWATSGRMGADINTQTVAAYDGKDLYFENLAERGPSIWAREAEERRILRAMDRSRRAMNPQYYNEDGTIKKGKKIWKNSKTYIKLRNQLKEIRRRNSRSRHYAIDEMVNDFRERCIRIITEEKNAAALMKKAKPKKKDEKAEGKKNARRKRFGHSIQNRCPGYLQQKLEMVFTSTGGTYVEVPVKTHKATQFDPLTGGFVEHKLWERIIKLGKDGEVSVLRDPKSAFGLYWTDETETKIDIKSAMTDAGNYIEADRRLQNEIRRNRRKVMNSGIRF